MNRLGAILNYMQPQGMKLETLKIFPYIAWGTVIIFAFFVYNLAVELRAISENLRETTLNLDARNNLPLLEPALEAPTAN